LGWDPVIAEGDKRHLIVGGIIGYVENPPFGAVQSHTRLFGYSAAGWILCAAFPGQAIERPGRESPPEHFDECACSDPRGGVLGPDPHTDFGSMIVDRTAPEMKPRTAEDAGLVLIQDKDDEVLIQKVASAKPSASCLAIYWVFDWLGPR
jgi:hypothetical protein